MFNHHRHHRLHRTKWFALVALPLVALASVVGLQGCFRHKWHDPERLEKKMAWVSEDIAEELEITANQRTAYDELMERVKGKVRGKATQMRQSMGQLRKEITRDTVDADRIATLVKEHLRQRIALEEQEKLVDDFVAFYKTLSPEQQALLKEKASKNLERHF